METYVLMVYIKIYRKNVLIIDCLFDIPSSRSFLCMPVNLAVKSLYDGLNTKVIINLQWSCMCPFLVYVDEDGRTESLLLMSV